MIRVSMFICLFISTLSVSAQQHALYSNYIFNLYMVNPAYAGARDALSTNLSVRSQWVGFEGAPRTQNFSMHSPITARNMSMGVQVQNDLIGARQATSAALSYAYKVRIKKDQYISFGLQGGLVNYYIDPAKLDYAVPADPLIYAFGGSHLMPNFDFGMMYLSKRSYIGLSATSLNGARISAHESLDSRLEPKFNFIAGKIFDMGDQVSVKPSMLVRKGIHGPMNFDANLGFLFFNSLWLTTSYRYQFGMVFSTHYLIREKLHIGYAFDWALNGLLAKQSGTHEIYLGIDFNVYRHRRNTPRYF